MSANDASAASGRFKRNQRLLTPGDFKRVFAKAERSGDRYWTVLSRRRDAGDARLGLAIAKRVVRQSSARNRLKRIVRESFRREASRLPGVDIVVLARRDTVAANNSTLFESLNRHWRNVIKPNQGRNRKSGTRSGD